MQLDVLDSHGFSVLSSFHFFFHITLSHNYLIFPLRARIFLFLLFSIVTCLDFLLLLFYYFITSCLLQNSTSSRRLIRYSCNNKNNKNKNKKKNKIDSFCLYLNIFIFVSLKNIEEENIPSFFFFRVWRMVSQWSTKEEQKFRY